MGIQPEHVVKIGAISASVFPNEMQRDGKPATVRNVKLQRRYKDQQGTWKSSSSFTLNELPLAIAVLQRAIEYVAAKEADG